MVSPELILFAIKAGVRLGQEARRAYIDLTRDRALVLPLPNADLRPDLPAARGFFAFEGAPYVEANPAITRLLAAAEDQTITPSESERLVNHYLEYMALYEAEKSNRPVVLSSDIKLDVEAFQALLTIRAHEDDDEGAPDILGRIAGTILELGIDYFVSVPGPLSKETAHGRIVLGFLSGLQDVPFADIGIDDDGLRRIAGDLFVAAIQTLGDQSETIVSDPRIQSLLKVTAHGLSRDVAKALEHAPDGNQRDRIRAWGEIVFRSLLSSAGRAVVNEPGFYFGIDDPLAQKMVERVGGTFLELAIENGPYEIERLFSRNALEDVISAALRVVGDHPELLDVNHPGLTVLIGEVASELAAVEGLVSVDVVPEITRIVLLKTGEHLELLWPDAADDPKRHLLLIATKTTLTILSRPPAGSDGGPGADTWRLRFTRADILAVVDAVVDELAGNPAWLIAAADDVDANLGAALGAVVGVLRERADERLSPAVAAEIIAAAVGAVATRQEFLEPIADARPLIASVIDALVASVFDPDLDITTQWQLVRRDALSAMVGISLEHLSGATLSDEVVDQLKLAVDARVQSIADGKAMDWDAFEAELATLIPT